MKTPVLLLAALLAAVAVACGDDDTTPPAPSATATPSGPAASPTPAPSATVPPSPAPTVVSLEPTGFPINRLTRLGLAAGESPERRIEWLRGPTALSYSTLTQPADDPVQANASGWNCRTHVEYEGQPAVDWYVPMFSPVYATTYGTAHLYVITASNAFDFYGVDREPYLGDPDRARAPLSPFPGPGGGKGIFIAVTNDEYVTEYAHLAPATIRLVPETAFIEPYGPASDLPTLFAAMRPFDEWTEVASWPVAKGDVIGLSGDSGYSEAPHLHYTLRRAGSGVLLCPTTEAGFADGGWLLKALQR